MTMHIDYPDYLCASCGNKFLPYHQNFPCPYCGTPSTKSFDLISQIVASLHVHKMNFGRFTPDARYSGSIAERIQMIVFQVMDILEHDKKLDPSLDEEKHLTAILDNKLAARNDKATEEYVKTIAIASYKMYSEKSKEMETIENESSLFTNQSPKETQ